MTKYKDEGASTQERKSKSALAPLGARAKKLLRKSSYATRRYAAPSPLKLFALR